jgi:crotonobetainyl-CoA:carnitine CoA-transferase CaiB-like acyl-CoA transferase
MHRMMYHDATLNTPITSKLPACEFFHHAQRRGLQVGIDLRPRRGDGGSHFAARGFPVSVGHGPLGSFVYPGAPYRFQRTPCRIGRRAPRLQEHDEEVFGPGGGSGRWTDRTCPRPTLGAAARRIHS